MAHFNPPSPWGEGQYNGTRLFDSLHFNPPSPWGEGRNLNLEQRIHKQFQSTLPVGGGTFRKMFLKLDLLFQSTLPVGGGTPAISEIVLYIFISIHPPRGGRDITMTPNIFKFWNFNPPSPWGEGQQKYTKILFDFMHFRQTLSHFSSPHPVFWERIKKTGGEFLKISVRRSQGNPGCFPLAPVYTIRVPPGS